MRSALITRLSGDTLDHASVSGDTAIWCAPRWFAILQSPMLCRHWVACGRGKTTWKPWTES